MKSIGNGPIDFVFQSNPKVLNNLVPLFLHYIYIAVDQSKEMAIFFVSGSDSMDHLCNLLSE